MPFDPSEAHLYAVLPPLPGDAPPATCPICAAKQVPPESDEGLPPPEQHEYACGATYLRPEDEPGPWEPYRTCGRLLLSTALAWIREESARTRLNISLPRLKGEHAPDACPVCGTEIKYRVPSRSDEPGYASNVIYACGGDYWATSTRPGTSGHIPMTWGCTNKCARPSLRRLFEVLRAAAERDGDRDVAAASDEALRTLALVVGS